MKDLTKQYEIAKSNSIKFMRNGQISAYFNALLEMSNSPLSFGHFPKGESCQS